MDEYDRQMLAYLTLARISGEKQQPSGRDRFWILAGVAACRAGWPEVASRCRELVIAGNPRHLLGRFSTLPDAMRDSEFEPFLRQLERFCGFEQAEHFVREQGLELPESDAADELSPGDLALALLPREATS